MENPAVPFSSEKDSGILMWNAKSILLFLHGVGHNLVILRAN